jgi:sugar phosphate permease
LATVAPTSERASYRGWAVGVSVYLLAVLHRTSLGVAGLLAEQRFHITPAQLSIFVLLQIGVYAGMQVPAGVLVDRYGPRRLLFIAATLMGFAQLAFAEVGSYPVALLARAVLGCGDALTFVSLLRFVATHFSARRYPMLVALTALAGTVGNVVATLPLALLLRSFGWAPTFAVAGLLSLLAAVAVWLLLPDATPAPRRLRGASEVRSGAVNVQRRVTTAWRLPGTRLGFWVHFACMSAPNTFAVLWGSQYLVKGAGFSKTAASSVLLVSVLVAAVGSLAIGAFIGRRPALRVPLAIIVCAVTVAGWAFLLTAYNAPPHVLVVVQFSVMAFGTPASMIGFALARDYNSAANLGTASGVVNVGGFLATVIAALGVGWVLDAVGSANAHGFRLALVVIVVVQGFGAIEILRWWRKARARILASVARGEAVPVPIVRRRWDLELTDG